MFIVISNRCSQITDVVHNRTNVASFAQENNTILLCRLFFTSRQPNVTISCQKQRVEVFSLNLDVERYQVIRTLRCVSEYLLYNTTNTQIIILDFISMFQIFFNIYQCEIDIDMCVVVIEQRQYGTEVYTVFSVLVQSLDRLELF